MRLVPDLRSHGAGLARAITGVGEYESQDAGAGCSRAEASEESMIDRLPLARRGWTISAGAVLGGAVMKGLRHIAPDPRVGDRRPFERCGPSSWWWLAP